MGGGGEVSHGRGKRAVSLLIVTLFSLLLTLTFPPPTHAEDINRLTNSTFDKDLSGWTVEGKASIETDAPLEGNGSLLLGPGQCAITQRYAVPGLRIVWFGATFRPADTTGADMSSLVDAFVRARCYNAKGHLVMEERQSVDPKKATLSKGGDVGVYFKTQAHTAWMVVSIEKEGKKSGSIRADFAKLVDYDYDRVAHAPLCDLDQYMQPIWQGKTVYNETILPLAENGQPAQGRLLFSPTKILSVRSYDLSITYREGTDYTLSGRILTVPPGSRIPTVSASDLPSGDLPWPEMDGKHIVVTYAHSGVWQGPIPGYAGDKLPQTMRKLRAHKPLVIVAHGDSITQGLDTSGYMQIPPYMPTWADMFVYRLKKLYGYGDIRLYNTALGGQTSYWAKETAQSAVASLEPDLVLLAFGMNDFWWISGEDFRKNIAETMRLVRTRKPDVEFVLISSMPFDPAYTSDPAYREHMASYVMALRALTGEGVCMLDMDQIAGALFTAKKPKDLISNPMHPNDFLARWYAQGLAAMLTPPHRP